MTRLAFAKRGLKQQIIFASMGSLSLTSFRFRS